MPCWYGWSEGGTSRQQAQLGLAQGLSSLPPPHSDAPGSSAWQDARTGSMQAGRLAGGTTSVSRAQGPLLAKVELVGEARCQALGDPPLHALIWGNRTPPTPPSLNVSLNLFPLFLFLITVNPQGGVSLWPPKHTHTHEAAFPWGVHRAGVGEGRRGPSVQLTVASD